MILLLGTGEMAEAYAKTLERLGGPEPLVVGRSEEGAARFRERTGLEARAGGLAALNEAPERAIVAVSAEELAGATAALIERGCHSILVEKPGALRSGDLEYLAGAAEAAGAAVHVAFNRRFYPSMDVARRAIEEDGRVLAASFDFTELEDRVLAEAGRKRWSPGVLARWGVVNSSHVVDLFAHLAGRPSIWECRQKGRLDWHPSGAVFAGSGETDRGALFAYVSAWNGAGRWSLELTTARRRLILRPLETLTVQRRGSLEHSPVELPEEPKDLKPGLRGQVAAFLAGSDPRLCSLVEAAAHIRIAEEIMGYE